MKPASLPHWLQRNLTRIVACLLVALRKRSSPVQQEAISAEVPAAVRAAS
jgi:hypothetical protein